jgi:hypothetical protein
MRASSRSALLFLTPSNFNGSQPYFLVKGIRFLENVEERKIGPRDPSPELYSFVLGLTREQLKNTSIEDARREENFCVADQLHAKALARGDNHAIELDRLVQGRISTARSSDHW